MRGNLENVCRGHPSPLADMEPVITLLIKTSNEARNPVDGIQGIINLAELLITNTEYEQKSIDFQARFCPESKQKYILQGHLTSANFSSGWARGFLACYPEVKGKRGISTAAVTEETQPESQDSQISVETIGKVNFGPGAVGDVIDTIVHT
jgi:hypothetical protein